MIPAHIPKPTPITKETLVGIIGEQLVDLRQLREYVDVLLKQIMELSAQIPAAASSTPVRTHPPAETPEQP